MYNIKNNSIYFLGFIGNIFSGGRRRKQKVCHSYKCAQCTSNRHCSGNQVCSGYTCVSPQTYTEKPFYWTTTTQAPYYDYNKDYNNFDSYTIATPKPFDTSKYFDESSIYNFDASKFNNFDSATDFGAFDFKK